MSATVDIKALVAQMKNKKAILTGVFLQFGVLPLLGFMVVKVLDLNENMGITLLVLTSSPGGSYSNWYVVVVDCALLMVHIYIYIHIYYFKRLIHTMHSFYSLYTLYTGGAPCSMPISHYR